MLAGKKLTYLVYYIFARAVYEKNLNFQPLEAVSRYRDPQLQVAEISIRTPEIVCWLEKKVDRSSFFVRVVYQKNKQREILSKK